MNPEQAETTGQTAQFSSPDPGLRAFIERRCPLHGKTRYATKAEARRFAASTPNLTTAYRCQVCDAYHVASRRRGHR